MNTSSLLRFVAVVVFMQGAGGCVTTALGIGATDHDLRNDGSPEAQDGLYRAYEVVYENQVFRRPGVPAQVVAAELNLEHVDDVAAWAFSDDAYNYLSSSTRAAAFMDHPAVAFDAFAHSGQGQAVLMGTGVGAGAVAGSVAWFIRTTVRDGVTADEASDLWLTAGGGFLVGGALGVIVAAAYTYIVPSLSAPLATPQYRQAARAFNEELDERLQDAAPAGDAPPDPDSAEGDTDADRGDSGDDGDDVNDDAATTVPATPPTPAPASPATTAAPTPKAGF